MAKTKKPSVHGSTQTRWLAALGMLFVLGSFAMLVRESIVNQPTDAEITIEVREIRQSAQGYLVAVSIRNSGNATAAALAVEGVLKRNGTELETSLVTVDYVAAGSERGATLLFANDPRAGELTVRAKGYIEP